MTPLLPENLAASVRQRLLNLAHGRGEEFQFVLTRFGLERLLHRLATSKHSESFLLKGALLFSVWSEQIYRPTRDLDLAGRGNGQPERIAEIFRDLCLILYQEDGLTFDRDSIGVERIRELQRYPGVRVQLMAYLASARIPLQVDIGFGDAVTPAPTLVDYPTLLGHPAPQLRAYPQETVIAEKFQAMVLLGMANSRIKDFYDLWVLARNFDFTGDVLCEAIRATFQRRQTPAPVETPIALTNEYSEDRTRKAAWRSFLQRMRQGQKSDTELSEICSFLEGFLMPPSQAAALGERFESEWKSPGPWRRKPSPISSLYHPSQNDLTA